MLGPEAVECEMGPGDFIFEELEETKTKKKVQAWNNEHGAAGSGPSGEKRQHQTPVPCRR